MCSLNKHTLNVQWKANCRTVVAAIHKNTMPAIISTTFHKLYLFKHKFYAVFQIILLLHLFHYLFNKIYHMCKETFLI